jgi:glycosyltransferase involved in cell wall biosynthesis
MKVLHVTPCYLPGRRYGGPIASVHGLARAMAARGHEVSVYTTDLDGWLPILPPPGPRATIDGVDVRYFETGVGRRVHRAPAMRDALREQVAEHDVVHVHGLFTWPSVTGAREAERAGVPYVLSPRGMLVRDLIQRRGRVRKELWIRAFERRTFERAALVHATSDLEAAELGAFAFASRPIATIPNGVDHEPFDGDLDSLDPAVRALVERDDVILYLGRINWKKGLDRLVRAFAELDAGHLALAGGDDGYGTELEQLVRDLRLTRRVTFLGPVTGRDKAALLERSTALALVSRNENFGNVVLESMAAGLPVVVSRDVGAAPIVQSTGAGFVVHSDADLTIALARLLDDRDLATTMGTAGRTAAHRYTWTAIATTFETTYDLTTARAA